MEGEDEEALMFHSYPCELYYVQSPSPTSHHSNNIDNCLRNITELSSIPTEFHSPINNTIPTASRCSSSRGSNNSYPNPKKNRLVIVDGSREVEVNDGGYGLWKYLAFGTYSRSWVWLFLQISWRVMVSLCVALLVFYAATKPAPPLVSIKMAETRAFELGEGVDVSGVSTKLLSCNFSIDVVIDNKSKIFGLHIHPPIMSTSFARLHFAFSQGSELYAASDGLSLFQLSIGTRNKPMYGAGRLMEDMLESGNGLPILINMSLRSNFRVLWSIIKPKFNHRAECLLILKSGNHAKYITQAYNNNSCIITN